MEQTINLDEINNKIKQMKGCADELKGLGKEFPALDRNIIRILASLKMLELNVSDIIDL